MTIISPDEIAEISIKDLLDLQSALAQIINAVRRKKGISKDTNLNVKLGSVLTRTELNELVGPQPS